MCRLLFTSMIRFWGYSGKNPPRDPDRERVEVVKEFIELWANSLHAAGVPREKIFCHIAFTSQGLRTPDARASFATKVEFGVAEVAFSSAYCPGFSTYPEGATYKEIYTALAQHGSPTWISGEGVNVSPSGMPGEANMETYLGRMFNHGAVMVNIFSWGIGGEANRDNFFRKATENPEALAAYAKLLKHATMVETASSGFSAALLQEKMHRIQKEFPGWIQKSGQQAKAAPLMQKLSALMNDKNWQELDEIADQVLSMMAQGEKP
jgi:hypothetical protein